MLAALLLAAAPAPVADPWTREERAEIRRLVTEILGEPDAAKRERLARDGARWQEQHAFADLAAVSREGPLLPEDPLAPRRVAGQAEKLSRFGSTVVGLAFVHAGDTYRYAVDLPAKFDPAVPRAVLIDPGHVSGKGSDDEGKAGFLEMFRRHANEAGLGDWLVVRSEILEQIGGDGLRGERPEDEVVEVFDAFFRDLVTRFRVDPDRIHVTGLSQTGYWAWYLGCTRAERLAGIAPMSAVTWQVNRRLENLLGLPVHVLHGAQDPTCPVAQPRATCARLAAWGGDVAYVEIPTGKHDYAVWSRQPDALRWLAERPRQAWPKRVSKALASASDGGAAWIRVRAIAKAGDGRAGHAPTAGIDGEVDGQEIRLFSTGVEQVALALAPELVDLAQPVRVVWNGAVVHEGRVEPSFADLLAFAGERADASLGAHALLELSAPR